MPYAKIEKSGCEVWHKGLVKTRYDIFLTPDDFRYDETYKYVPVITEPYPGKVDKKGNPRSQKDYQAWLDKLPHIWQLSPIVSHFIRFNPEVSQEEVERAIEPHIPNFYKAWCEHLDDGKCGMRHGWDVATRWRAIGRPKRYDKEYSELELAPRITACESKLALIVASNLTIVSDKEGEIFPSTDIDVGSAAIDRSSVFFNNNTYIDIENPANAAGTIDTYEIWANSNLSGTNKVGVFYGSSLSYTSRDHETIGTVSSGSKQTFTSLDIDVDDGDYAGIFHSAGYIEASYSGGTRVYSKGGDQFGAGEQTYSYTSSANISLYGTGETAGWSNIAKICGVTATDLAKIDGVAVADIAKICGVAV